MDDAVVVIVDDPVASADLAYEVDYNEMAKKIIGAGLGKVPYVGFILSSLVQVLWPSREEDVWAKIEAKVEALVNRKISEQVWRQVSDALSGLRLVLDDYVYFATHFPDDPKVISEKWNVAQGHFLHDLPAFQSKDYQLLLLPLFAQFGNLHLSLLRDGALFGGSWGWSPAVVDRVKAQLKDAIDQYGRYANATYEAGLAEVRRTAPSNKKHTEPYNTVNRFQREMTLTVGDFTLTWPYFDVAKYPQPVQIPVTREIYSQLCGTADDSGVSLPARPPTKPIAKLTVWGWDRVDAAKVDYPEGGGPDGRTSTGRMGNSHGGSDKPPWGGTFELAQTGQVAKVRVLSDDILNAMWLTFENGSTSQQLGGKYPGGKPSEWQFPGEILSSIKIMGASRFYGSADAAVYGFKYKDERFPPPDAEALRLFFISDPASPTPQALAEKLGLGADDAAQLVAWAADYHWQTQRDAVAEARRLRLDAAET